MDEKILKIAEILDLYRKDMIGKRYRHFKGNVYVVTDIAIDCEHLDMIVIYKDCSNHKLTWCRTLLDFMADVDSEKYPEVIQKMRFEPLEN